MTVDAALSDAFEQAARDVQGLRMRPANADLLELYALYKQATLGDVQGKRPGITSLAARAKYDAWAGMTGLDGGSAMRRYVAKVDDLRAIAG